MQMPVNDEFCEGEDFTDFITKANMSAKLF